MILDHISYNVRDFAASRAFFEKALAALGGSRRRLGDCGAFVIDPDGNNIEAVCHHAE